MRDAQKTSFFYPIRKAEKNSWRRIKRWLSGQMLLACLLWGAVIFAIDLSAPLGVAVAVPYVGLVLMGLWLPHMAYIPIAAAGATGLTVLGFLNSPGEGDAVFTIYNRLVALVGIWVTALLCYLYKRDEKELRNAHVRLKQRVAELEDMKSKFERYAKTDPLTELPNRRGIREKMDYEILRFERNRIPFSILMADIDNFKTINDTLGHDAGDHILAEVARLIREQVRKTDMVCRWGGEEFLALLPETDLEGAVLLAEKLCRKIESTPFPYGDGEIPLTVSFGVSVYSDGDVDLDECIKEADECLYEAKKAGKNRVISLYLGNRATHTAQKT